MDGQCQKLSNKTHVDDGKQLGGARTNTLTHMGPARAGILKPRCKVH